MVKRNLAKFTLKEILTRQLKYIKVQPYAPEDIADIIHFVVSRPYHVNIADLIVMPTAKLSTIVKRDQFNYILNIKKLSQPFFMKINSILVSN
jgi:hypothetical protein